MNFDAVIAWVWENKETIGIFAVIATAIGALYQPTRDLLEVLPKMIWNIVKYTVLTIWVIIWPIRKLVAWLYEKFASKHVEKFFDNIFEWFEQREATKEIAQEQRSIE